MFVPRGKVPKTPSSPASSTLRRSEAKRLLDVASEAKISDGSSTYLKSMLENFSTEFSVMNDTSDASPFIEESEEQEASNSDEGGSRDSNELSLSDVAGDADNEAKRQLLMQILSSNPPRGAATVPGALPRAAPVPTSTEPRSSDFASATGAGTGYFNFEGSNEKELRAEIERLSGLLEDRRILFRDLTISDAMLNELQRKHESDLTMHELACLRSAEFSLPIKRNLESTRLELESCQKKLSQAESALIHLNAELERLKRVSESAREGEEMEKRAVEERCKRALMHLEAEAALRRQYEDKAARCDKAEEDAARLKAEVEELRTAFDQQGKALSALSESEKIALSSAADVERVKGLLQQDKTFLQQELRNAEALADEKARLAEANASKALALELKVAQLTDQLMALQLSTRNEFDLRMEREMQRLREESQRETDALKMASRDLADRENRVLRETKASLEAEVDNMRRRFDTLTAEHSELLKSHALTISERNKEISELRADLKMKIFELTALGASFEERMSQLRHAELEAQTAKEEVLAHRSAFLQLETESAHKISNLQSALDEALSRLRSYEELEDEIDEAILRIGGGQIAPSSPLKAISALRAKYEQEQLQERGVSETKSSEDPSGQLLSLIRGIPTNPDRRIKQCVHLAQRLLEAEGQRDEAKKKAFLIENDMISLKKELEAAKTDLVRTAQPTSYIVAKLREEEDARVEAQARVKALEGDLSVVSENLRLSTEEVVELKERLALLLQQRAELERLRGLLEMWRDEEEEEFDEDDEEEEDNDEGNVNMGAQSRLPVSAGEHSQDRSTIMGDVSTTGPATDFATTLAASIGGPDHDTSGTSTVAGRRGSSGAVESAVLMSPSANTNTTANANAGMNMNMNASTPGDQPRVGSIAGATIQGLSPAQLQLALSPPSERKAKTSGSAGAGAGLESVAAGGGGGVDAARRQSKIPLPVSHSGSGSPGSSSAAGGGQEGTSSSATKAKWHTRETL